MSKMTYNELIQIPSYEERLKYLQLGSKVGEDTFAHARYLNQQFYKSNEWNEIRNKIILRDDGCDMGLSDYPIFGRLYIHHINPITVEDLLNRSEKLLDANNLICVSFDTHQQIHYGIKSDDQLNGYRTHGDTKLW